MAKQLEKHQEVERSIITTYRKTIWSPFVLAVKKYNLIEAGDKIAVCISGGKDSMLLAKLMQQLQRHSEVPFELIYLVMDPGYNAANRKRIEENAATLNIPITVFESDVFAVGRHANVNNRGYVTRNIVKGKRRRICRHFRYVTVRNKTELDKCLETVTNTKCQTVAVV